MYGSKFFSKLAAIRLSTFLDHLSKKRCPPIKKQPVATAVRIGLGLSIQSPDKDRPVKPIPMPMPSYQRCLGVKALMSA